jgi:hypothetical protein
VPPGNLEALWEQVKLLCTVYDPASGRYRLNYAVFIEIFTGTTVLLGTLWFVASGWRRRRDAA